MTIMRWRRPERGLSCELARLQSEMDRLFDFSLGHRARLPEVAFAPAIDLYSEEGHLRAKVDLPGVKPSDIQVSATGNVLTVRGKREHDSSTKGDGYEYCERVFGEFERSIELPVPVEAGKVEAKFADGVLDITLPLREDIKPKQIEIKVK